MKKMILCQSALLLWSFTATASGVKGLARPGNQIVETYGFVSRSDHGIVVETSHEIYDVDSKIFFSKNKIDKDSQRRQQLVRFPSSAILHVVRVDKMGER